MVLEIIQLKGKRLPVDISCARRRTLKIVDFSNISPVSVIGDICHDVAPIKILNYRYTMIIYTILVAMGAISGKAG